MSGRSPPPKKKTQTNKQTIGHFSSIKAKANLDSIALPIAASLQKVPGNLHVQLETKSLVWVTISNEIFVMPLYAIQKITQHGKLHVLSDATTWQLKFNFKK